jgi:hypothetical protein
VFKHCTLAMTDQTHMSRHDILMQAHREGGGIAPTHSQTPTGRRWVVSTMLWPLNPQERPITHCTEGWVGLQVGLDSTENLSTPGFNFQAIQPVVSCYTIYILAADQNYIYYETRSN